FLQAEDGIRDGHVTGVQTCALPISRSAGPPLRPPRRGRRRGEQRVARPAASRGRAAPGRRGGPALRGSRRRPGRAATTPPEPARSEERPCRERVNEEVVAGANNQEE